MKHLVRVWLLGYRSPAQFVEALRGKPAPHWGLYGQLTRALLDALLVYLPLALLADHHTAPVEWAF